MYAEKRKKIKYWLNCSDKNLMHTRIIKHDTCQYNVVYLFVLFNIFIGIMKLRILKKIDNEKHNIKKNY